MSSVTVTAPLRSAARERSAASEPLRVLVVDDHSLLRRGVCDLLRTDERVGEIAQAADVEGAIEQARSLQPHVVVLDVVLPGRSGIDAIGPLLEAAPGAKVLMLSMYDDAGYVRTALAAGASGYVLKDAADVELLGAVHAVSTGAGYVHPSLGARLLRREPEPAPTTAALSAREQEVLRLLALGHTNREIGEILQISARTAETHRSRIFKKLQVHSRAELLRYTLDEQLLDQWR